MQVTYKVVHPVSTFLHITGLLFAFIFFGWKLALILILINVDATYTEK